MHAGATMKTVPLKLNKETLKWSFDKSDLQKAISPKTKVLLLNTPHNPTGAVFNKDQLQVVVEVLRENPQITVVTDEVYEDLVYDGHEHVRLATFAGLYLISLSPFAQSKAKTRALLF